VPVVSLSAYAKITAEEGHGLLLQAGGVLPL
jgi:hypothetical protein